MRPGPYTCGHCGRDDVGTFFAGYSFADGEFLCHPNIYGRPDCYRLVTVYNHPMRHWVCGYEGRKEIEHEHNRQDN